MNERQTTERLVSVAFGVLTVLLTYLMASQLFESRLVGLLSSLFVAVSFWQVFMSRLGLRAVLMPPIQILTLLFFWRALKECRIRDFALAGVCGGLSLYTYQSSRFLPFVPLFFVVSLVARRENLRRAWAGLVLMVALWVAVFTPLGLYYVQNPQWFVLRASQTSLALQQPGAAGLQRIWQSTLTTLGMSTFRGDPTWRYNLADRPVFDWIIGSAFYVGVVISLVRSVRRPKLNPHALILITQAVTLVPGFVTDEAPHFLRLVGVVPTTFVFPAIAVSEMARLMRPRWRWLAAAGVGAWALFAGHATYRDYFEVWAHNPEARTIYNASLAEIADYLEHREDGEVLIASTDPSLDRVAFNLSAGDNVPEVRWFNAAQALPMPANDARQAQILVPAPVQMLEALRARLSAAGTEVLAPDGNLSFQIIATGPPAAPEHTAESVLGNQVHFLGYDASSQSLTAGLTFDLLLHWQVETNPDPRRAWKWFVHLVDRRGYEWANWSGQGYDVADWRPGDYVVQNVPLPVPFDAPDIDYHLEIGVFDQNSGERMPDAQGSDHVALAGFRVRPADPGSVAGIIQHRERRRLGDTLVFVGSVQSSERLASGQELTLVLAWAPERNLQSDLTFRLRLVAGDGSVAYETAWSPLGGEYPTSSWPAGNIIRDVVFVALPAGTPPGQYALVVSADGLEGSVQAGSLQVEP